MVASRVRVRWAIGWEGWSKERQGTRAGGGIVLMSAEFLIKKVVFLLQSCAVRLLLFRWELARRILWFGMP